MPSRDDGPQTRFTGKRTQTSGRGPQAPSSQADAELLGLRCGLPFRAIPLDRLQQAEDAHCTQPGQTPPSSLTRVQPEESAEQRRQRRHDDPWHGLRDPGQDRIGQ